MSEQKPSGVRAAGAVAVTVSTAALACGLCCVLPFAVPAAALGAFGAVAAWAAGSYPWIALAAILAVAAGWALVLSRSRSTGRRPARSTLVVMGAATAIMLLALAWPILEPGIIALVGG